MIAATVLKEHKKVEQLEATIAPERKDFQSTAAEQQKGIQTLAASLERAGVSNPIRSPWVFQPRPLPMASFGPNSTLDVRCSAFDVCCCFRQRKRRTPNVQHRTPKRESG
jgi:hypothetical protein